MLARSIRLSAVAALVAGAITAVAGAASAAPGAGTFTKITTPSHNLIYHFNGAPSATNPLTVSGQTSLDVTSVDIDCLFLSATGPFSYPFASAVTVTGGSFSTVAHLGSYPSSLPTNCRMRAVPTGVDPLTEYLSSYSGPILYVNLIGLNKAGSIPYGFAAVSEQGDGIAATLDTAQCGVALLATVAVPGMEVRGPGNSGCAFALPEGNLTTSGTSTASTIKVSGHNAYLPYVVHTYLRGTRSLTVTQSTLTTTFARFSNGDVTVTESAPLRRCSVSDVYPPTLGSCPALVSTGVKFMRVINLFRGAHQARFRDTFISTDSHAHAVTLQYQGRAATPTTGATGFTFPGHGSGFHATHLDQVVTGLGSRAATMFITSNIYAVNGDPAANTIGLTWSRAPSKLIFSHTSSDLYAMPYSLNVPANGKAYLGFAESEHFTTAATRTVANLALTEMVNTPSISSPANHAVIHGHTTTVKGTVTVGANGLPTSVVVNGHAAHFTSVSATSKHYSVSFSEPFGTHTIKVTAFDSAHNSRSRSIVVTNVS